MRLVARHREDVSGCNQLLALLCGRLPWPAPWTLTVAPPRVACVWGGMVVKRLRMAWATGLVVAGGLWLAPQASAYVYWDNTTSDAIGRANLDGTGANQSFITGASFPYGVAVDGQGIYWDNTTSDAIGRANLDGTGVNQRFITGAHGPISVALDGHHIYWGNGNNNAIGRANLDGTGVNQSFITGADGLAGVAVDSQHIYWGNDGAGTIGRANLDGTGVDQSFISSTGVPNGVAVDGQHIYWTNSDSDGIGRANLDGTGVNRSFISDASHTFGVAVDGQHLYWTNFGNGSGTTIGRANLDGTGVNESLLTGAHVPSGIAVDSGGGGGSGGTGGGGGSGGSGDDNGEGKPTPAAGCKLPTVSVPGVGVLSAACFTRDATGSYSTTGRVRFNGLDVGPVDPSTPFKLTIDPGSATLTLAGSAQFKMGSIVVWKSHQEKLSYQLKVPRAAKARLVLRNIEQRVQATLKGFPLQGDVSLDFSPDLGGTISATIHVALQKPIPNVTGDATLSLSNASGLHVDNLEFKVPRATLGPISISNLDVSYKRATDTWEGTLTATFPVKPRDLTVTAGGKFVHGQFDSAHAYAKGLGITLANPTVFLNDLSLSVSREPKFDGTVALTAGPELSLGSSKLRLLGLNGEFLYEAPGGHSHFRLSGSVVILSNWGHVQGQIDYWPDTTTLTFGGGFNFPDAGFPFPTYGFSASGGLNGGFKPNGFEVEGSATLKWEQHVDIGFIHKTVSFEQGAQGVISDQGIAVCHTGWPDVGLGFSWSTHDFTAFGSNCDISPWRSRAFSSQAGAHTPTFTVRPGVSFEAFNLLGPKGDPPSLTIRGPHGQSASTSADFSPVLSANFLIMQIPDQNGQSRTFIEIRNPTPGKWTVSPSPGSAPIVGYQQADPLPNPRVHARLIGRASKRQLVWSLHPLTGQTVTFLETGSELSRVITTTDRGHGRLRFRPAPGLAGTRTVVAEIAQNGLPRRQETVLRFRAAGPPRPGAIRGLRIIRRSQMLVVHWQAAPHASGYELQAALSDGRRILDDLPLGQHAYFVRNVDPATNASVSVRGISGLSGYGRPSHVSTALRTPPLKLSIPARASHRRRLILTATATQTGVLNVELLYQSGGVIRSARARLRRGAHLRLSISLAGIAPRRYTVLANYALEGSFKAFLSTRTLVVR